MKMRRVFLIVLFYTLLISFTFATTSEELTAEADSLKALGEELLEQAEYDQALLIFSQELKIRQLLADSTGEATSYNNIGSVYHYKGEYDQALEYGRKALDIQTKILGYDHLDVAGSYNNIAAVYWRKGDYDQAIKFHKKTLEIRFKALGPDHPDVALSYNNIGSVYSYKGDYELALEYYRKALSIQLKVLGPDHPGVATSYNNVGFTYWAKGDYEQSLEYYRKALEIWLKILGPDHPDVALSYNNIGCVYLNKGDYDQAIKFHKKTLDIRLKVLGPHHPDVAMTYNNIGSTYRFKANYAQALEYHKKALKIEIEAFDSHHPWVATGYNNIGSVYSDKGDYEQALKFHKKALDIRLKVLGPHHPGVALSYNKIGFVYRIKGEYDQALEYIDGGIKSMSIDTITGGSIDSLSVLDLRPLPITVELLHNRAKALLSARDDIEGIKKVLSSLSLANDLISRFREELATGTAKLHWSEEFYEMNQLAISLLVQLNANEHNPEYEKEAFLWSEQGRARVFLEQLGISRIPFSGIIPDELFRTEEHYRNEILRIDREIEQETKKSKEERQQAVIRELYAKRFAYEDSLKQWVNNVEKSYPIYIHFRYPKPSNLEEIQNVLKHDETLVSYSLLEDKTIAWIVRPDTFFMVELRISDYMIGSIVDTLRQDILRLSGTYKNRAGELYEQLFKPLEEYLEPNQVVYIISDGTLQFLPFGLLWDEEKEEFLLSRYKIVYIQSGSTLALLRKLKRKHPAKEKLIAFGDPVYKQSDIGEESIEVAGIESETDRLRSAYADRGMSFKRLELSGNEVHTISEIMGVKPLKPPCINLRLDANEEAVKSTNLSDYRYIHFACHGYLGDVEGGVMQPSLVLSLVGNKEEDGFLQMSEVYNLKLNADLVVLSACETGMGKLVRGEGIIGLTRAFMYAGTPSIVVSLWRVTDYSTCSLMKYFYRNLKDGMDKAEALRQAKMELIEKDGYVLPFFWASFVLVGECK